MLATRLGVIMAVVGLLQFQPTLSGEDGDSLDVVLATHVKPMSLHDCDVLSFLDAMNAAVGHRSLILPAFEAIPDQRANVVTRGGPLAEVLDETLSLWGSGWYRQGRYVLVAARSVARMQREIARIEAVRLGLARWLDGPERSIQSPPGGLFVLLAEIGFQQECNASYYVSPAVRKRLLFPKAPVRGTPRQILAQILPDGPSGIAIIGDLLYLTDKGEADDVAGTPHLVVCPLGSILDDEPALGTVGSCIDFLSAVALRIGIQRSFSDPEVGRRRLPGPEYLLLHSASSRTILFVLMKEAECDVYVVESMKPPYWSLHFRKE